MAEQTKVIIYSNHKDSNEALKLRNELQAKGADPILQNSDFFGGTKPADKVVIFGRKGVKSTDTIVEAYKKADGKVDIEVKDSPALAEADKKAKARAKGGSGQSAGIPKPTADNTVKQIKGYLDFVGIDYDSEAKKDELLDLIPG